MEKFIIRGGAPLCGTVSVSGAKNAALPCLAACLLTDEPVTLCRIPPLSDIFAMCDILSGLGCRISRPFADEFCIDASHLTACAVPYELAGRLRGSFLVLGPLLARHKKVSIAMPGGCAIGARPIDLHLKGFIAMGATVQNTNGCIEASCRQLHGATIYLDFPSVGATENIMSAAVLAQGETIIENAAAEPEIVDLANFLCRMGARITGAGTDTITIRGVERLHGARHTIIPDRIEAGTWLAAAVATGGDVTVTNIIPDYVKPMTAKLSEMNIPLTIGEDFIRTKPVSSFKAVDVKTLPYPGFPTDMQSQLSALLCLSDGISMITETIFENRFMHAGELCRMGASIKIAGRNAVIEGSKSLSGAKVKASDLRAGAALVIAALAAKGDTEISDIYHIDRGYVALDAKLRTLGASIKREPE
ncbi:MAG: UDP-N-acetylglucosamine 1-carboxyvinyltransferase [Ruminococcaceae bacterium]|nr:UDP-N-acetylglucosamine 1-carboxyvinyltransferase [Oscillospiraceae bacterium]